MRASRILLVGAMATFAAVGAAPAEESPRACSEPTVHCVGAGAEYDDIQHAVDAARPGDTVWVQPGDYGGFRVRRGGTAERRLRIAAAAGARIVGSEPFSQEAIYLENVSWVTLEGFEIDASSLPGVALGAHDARPETPMRGLVIRNNVVRGAGSTNIYLSQVSESIVEGNVTANSKKSHGIYLSNAGSDNTVLRGNNSYGNAKNGIHFNGDLASTGDGLQTGLTVESNIIHGNAANGLNMDGVRASRVVNNLVFGNRRHAMRAYRIDGADGPERMVVVNNTFVDNGGWAIKFTDDDGGHVIFNNILLSSGGSIAVSNSRLASDYNLAAGPFSVDGESTTMRIEGWRRAGLGAATRGQPGDLFVDAKAGDYRPTGGLVGQLEGAPGLAGEVAPAKDLLGRTRGVPPTIGAIAIPADPAQRGG